MRTENEITTTEEWMRAIRYHQFGSAEVLRMEQAPRPVPKAGELLVRVQAAGVLPVDWKIRKGMLPLPVKFPSIPGTAFAGIVEVIGEGVAGFRKGQEVYGRSTNGTYAEYTTAPADQVVVKPRSLSMEETAALTGGATTAWRAIVEAGVKAGDRVLIHGAAGGVGLFAVQFAKSRGAYVIGTAGTSNQAFIRSLGVDQAIDYTQVPFEDAVQDADCVMDTIGGQTLERSWSVVKRGGVLISIAGQLQMERGQEQGVRIVRPGLAASQDLKDIASVIDEGQARPFIQRVYPFEEYRQAHERSESGHGRGRIVLRVGSLT